MPAAFRGCNSDRAHPKDLPAHPDPKHRSADNGAGRFLATTISARSGGLAGPLYVHAKIGIVDDAWLTVGSANLNEHSFFNDSEMNVVTCDPRPRARPGCGSGPSISIEGYKGVSKKFLDDSKTREMGCARKRAFTAIGVFGHLARLVVFGLIGYGLVTAAVDYNPRSAIGLDGALNKLLRNSYGPLMLGVVAAGLIGFALYSIADARYTQF